MTELIRVMAPEPGWPISHLNAGTAKSTILKAAAGKNASHFITGYLLTGGATTDGFHLLRRSCIEFTTTDTWTIADGGTVLDIAAAATGNFTFEVWLKIPTASAATNILTRGDPGVEGYTFEVTSGGLLKFTARDAANAITATGTKVLNDGNWHYLAVSVTRASATGLVLVVDGVQETLSAGSASTTAMTAAIDSGITTAVQTGTSSKTHYLGPLGFYNGASGALSVATMLSNYNDGNGRKYDGSETGLACAYNNDEGISTANHDILGTAGVVVTSSGTQNVPYKRVGATAGVTESWNPKDNAAEEELPAVGKFVAGIGTAFNGVGMMFPHAIKIGRALPVSILETDGGADLLLFGYTEHV